MVEIALVDFNGASNTYCLEELIRVQLQKQEPLLLKGAIHQWPACQRWSAEYLRDVIPDYVFVAKRFENNWIAKFSMSMKEYCDLIIASRDIAAGRDVPYCHDIPIFHDNSILLEDVGKFPVKGLPKFYWRNWPKYAQYFMGIAGSGTPLHFDVLLTNNLFFQINGKKEFTLISYANKGLMKRKGWRWFEASPDDELPTYAEQVVVECGDMLLMPSGMLHAVKNLTDTIAFNIDFHTADTVFSAMQEISYHTPSEVFKYNSLLAAGLVGGVAEETIFPRYSSYLGFVS